MVLDGTVKYLEKQCPTGYGKSYADTVLISYIFGVDINSDILKVVGNPSLVTDMANKLIKYMCKNNYAKVFPYYSQFNGDSGKMFDVCREGGNNQPARLLIHGSIKGTSFLMINKDTPIDGGRFKYRFYDDITRSKDKGNARMHEKDIATYQDQWKKRKYDDKNSFEIFSGTTYHIYDFLSTVKRKYGGDEAAQSKVNKYTKFNPKYRSVFVSVPKLDWDKDESTYPHKYTTEEAKADRQADYNTFMAMDMQEPMPIEGCAFSYDNLQCYDVIPHDESEKDTESCWAMLDPARTGANYVSMPICIPINGKHYLKDCIYEMKPMEKVHSVIISKIIQHHITRLHVERNTDTSLKTLLDEELHKRGVYYCNITEIYTTKKKENKIYDNEESIKSGIVFPAFGLYSQGSEMGKFMKHLTTFSYIEKNLFDDSIDSIAMYSEKFISFKKAQNTISFISRK
jgi:predicted phage terminase large subunit-like protein